MKIERAEGVSKYKRPKGGVNRKTRLKAGERGHREEEIRGRKGWAYGREKER